MVYISKLCNVMCQSYLSKTGWWGEQATVAYTVISKTKNKQGFLEIF